MTDSAEAIPTFVGMTDSAEEIPTFVGMTEVRDGRS